MSHPTILDNDEGDDDEYTWTTGSHFSASNPLHSQMRDIEAMLRCPICHDFLRIPVSLPPCQHSFCSECIRSSLKVCIKTKQREECPVCRNKCEERKLTPNPLVERLVRQFRSIKPLLKIALSGEVSNVHEEHKEVKGPVAHSSSSDIQPTQIFFQKEASSSSAPPVKRRTALKYHGLKKKKLVELCQAEGLSTLGDEATLIQRHKDFCLLVNSECDSENPRSEDELRRILAQREHSIDLEQKRARREGIPKQLAHLETLKRNRAMAGEGQADSMAKITSGNADFDREIQNGFSRLIAQARLPKKAKSTTDQVKSDDNQQDVYPNSLPIQATDSKVEPKQVSITVVPTQSFDRAHTHEVDSGKIEDLQRDSPVKNSPDIASPKPYKVSRTSQSLQTTVTPHSSAKKKAKKLESPSSITGPWVCSRCTFYNKVRIWTDAKCEMCEMAKRAQDQLTDPMEVIGVDC